MMIIKTHTDKFYFLFILLLLLLLLLLFLYKQDSNPYPPVNDNESKSFVPTYVLHSILHQTYQATWT